MLHIHKDYWLNFRVKLDKGGPDTLRSKLQETQSTDWRHYSCRPKCTHTLKKMWLQWSSWHSTKKTGHTPEFERLVSSSPV